MRLIDADDFKKTFALLMWKEHNPYDVIPVCDIVNRTLDFIDDASTVTPDMAQVLAYESGKANAENVRDRWIPVKWHYISDEERAKEGYPQEWVYILDSPTPNDGEEILIQTKGGYITTDYCYVDDGYYLDSGYDWRVDIVAWMPLPQPYKENSKDEID